MTQVRTALADAARRLAEAGVASPRNDAELLLAHVLGTGRAGLLLVDRVDHAQATAYEELVVRRAAREPLQHLTGSAAFRYRDLAVGPGGFVPRPETESLVEWGLSILDSLEVEHPVVVDLGTGSGAIAGARGNATARIFTTCLDPQLVAIAGVYRTTEVPLTTTVPDRPW